MLFRNTFKISVVFPHCLVEYEKFTPLAVDVDWAMQSMCVLIYSGMNLRLVKILELNIPGSKFVECRKIAMEVEYDKMEQNEFEGENENSLYSSVFNSVNLTDFKVEKLNPISAVIQKSQNFSDQFLSNSSLAEYTVETIEYLQRFYRRSYLNFRVYQINRCSQKRIQPERFDVNHVFS